MFWKRKKSGKELAKEVDQDIKKGEWFLKMLTKPESNDFLLAHETAMIYDSLNEDREPTQERSNEMKQQMEQFKTDVEKIVKNHDTADISERDRQVEELIRQADFSEGSELTPVLFCYFRGYTDKQRIDWDERNRMIEKEIYGFIAGEF